jgi:DNA-binding response OmpR family regulator
MKDNHTLTILLVEHRDEVFARLAADLAGVGMRVDRAHSGLEAADRCRRRRPDLLMVNAWLPDESGWLVTGKLRLADPELPIWIYTPRSSSDDVAMANFIEADELIDYEGDLWRLAADVANRLGVPGGAIAPVSEPTWAQEPLVVV